MKIKKEGGGGPEGFYTTPEALRIGYLEDKAVTYEIGHATS